MIQGERESKYPKKGLDQIANQDHFVQKKESLGIQSTKLNLEIITRTLTSLLRSKQRMMLPTHLLQD